MAITLVGCSKDEEPTEQTFFVNVYHYQSESTNSAKRLAEQTWVSLHRDNGRGVGRVDALNGVIYDEVGAELPLKATSPSNSGANTFENIPNGKYVMLILHTGCGGWNFTWEHITVDGSYNHKTVTVTLDCSTGYSDWG